MSHTDAPSESSSDVFTPVFQAPDLDSIEPVKVRRPPEDPQDGSSAEDASSQSAPQKDDPSPDDGSGSSRSRRKRRRGGRSRSKGGDGRNGESSAKEAHDTGSADKDQPSGQDDRGEETPSEDAERDAEGQVIRKRRRRRRGSMDMEIEETEGDEHTVTRVRAAREVSDSAPTKVTGVKGSTRLEAKRQRRRASREGGRRRQIITEAEFLARRESVDRQMIVRQRGERIQIGVLEDGVLAEHYVSNTSQDSLIGNVYLGKVQNVLPSMEAAFIDIGRGRNAVLYAGEVDWDSANLGNAPRKIENALKSGDSVLVQVTKDPVGHKGARLTSQVSLPGRYLVFVPGGSMTGISRKLPDTERARLKKILKEQMPENAGVIVRTAAEGASEEELTNDINRLRALWESVQTQADDRKVLAPELLYAEPDLTIKVVRDVFNEDFSSCAVQGEETWDNVEAYVTYVAPHLLDRLQRWDPEEHEGQDIFAHHRIDEQLNKALDRKVNLPSGGSLVFDRTEAMTVVDVNTGKFTGSGGNLEETVTKNNLEAAEEIVRQLRLRDVGGIIVIDFIDMVLEANRDLVLRRLVECLGRDRTKHQVAEVTSLGLVQMTRKRMGTGLLEVFSECCEHCAGRGLLTYEEPVAHKASYTSSGEASRPKSKKRRKGRNKPGGDGPGHNELSAEERKKQERARQALAQVAAATTGQPEEKAANAEEQQNEEAQGGAEKTESQKDQGQKESSRKRGRRRRGAEKEGGPPERTSERSSGRQEPQGDESAPVLTIGGEEVPVPRTEGGEKQQTDAEARSGVSLNSLDEALASRTPSVQGSEGRRSRRRRAAGSAQGSAAEVHEVSSEASGPGKTFTASAPPAAAEKSSSEQPASEPVMFGVGVSAQELARAAQTPQDAGGAEEAAEKDTGEQKA